MKTAACAPSVAGVQVRVVVVQEKGVAVAVSPKKGTRLPKVVLSPAGIPPRVRVMARLSILTLVVESKEPSATV